MRPPRSRRLRLPLSRLVDLALWLGLAIVVAWPALAIAIESRRGDGLETIGVAGGIMRPLGLARETLHLLAAVLALVLPTATVAAWLLARSDLIGRRLLTVVVVTGVFVPLPLLTLAWLGAFGNLGRSQALGSAPWLVGFWGAAIVDALAALPWAILLIAAGLRLVEPELEEAALIDLPARKVVVLVTLRRTIGAIGAASLAVAVLVGGDMTVTDLVRPPIRTFAEEAYTLSQLGAAPAIVALPPLVLLAPALFLASFLLARLDAERIVSQRRGPRTWELGQWQAPMTIIAWVFTAMLIGLPLYGMLWRAGRVGGGPGRPPQWSFAGLVETVQLAWQDVIAPLIETSLWAAVAATVSVLFAWGLAWRSRQPGPWRWVTGASLALALACPGPVAGMALKLAYNPYALIADTPALLVLAYVLRTFPYALLLLWPLARMVPRDQLDAASLDGCGAWGTLRHVLWPSMSPALLAAWLVAFALGLGELAAAYQVAPPGTNVLATLIWGQLHSGVESKLAGAGLILAAVIALLGVLGTLAFLRISQRAALQD